MKKYRVIHIIWALNSGGAENMLVDIVNEQCKTENVGLIIINDSIDSSIFNRIDDRVKVWMIKRQQGSRNVIPIIKLNYLLLRLKYHCLHCHNHGLIKILKFIRSPIYLTIHAKDISTIHLRKYSKLFAISETVREDIKKRCNIDSLVIFNGIKSSELKHTYIENEYFRIVCIARFNISIKGQDILINAINILKNKLIFERIRVDFIGGRIGNYSDDFTLMKNKVKFLGLDSCISFLGDKNREYIYDNLYSYNLLVQASRIEGFGLVVAEAMAARVPVLISCNDGPLEIIDNGKYGFSFENGSVEDCSRLIEEIYHKGIKEIDTVKNDAYKRVNECFDMKITVGNYLKNY